MNNFQPLLLQRRSIRKFRKEQLTADETRLILEAALLSPTSKNRRSWEFIAVEQKEMLVSLSTMPRCLHLTYAKNLHPLSLFLLPTSHLYLDAPLVEL